MRTSRIANHRIWLAAFVVLTAVVAVGIGMLGFFSTPATEAPQKTAANSASSNASKSVKKSATKPRWVDLSSAQKEALAPLAAEWDQIHTVRKHKWLEIGDQIAKMDPPEKQRVQDRIRDWVKLTPEQRRVARSNYEQAKKLDAAEIFAQWQQYQQLSEIQKKELADSANSKKLVVNPPAKSEKNPKIARSIKLTPKLELEKSVQPTVRPPVTPTPVSPTTPSAPNEAYPA